MGRLRSPLCSNVSICNPNPYICSSSAKGTSIWQPLSVVTIRISYKSKGKSETGSCFMLSSFISGLNTRSGVKESAVPALSIKTPGAISVDGDCACTNKFVIKNINSSHLLFISFIVLKGLYSTAKKVYSFVNTSY